MISNPIILNALQYDVSSLLNLVYIDWPTAPVRMHSRIGEKYWDGQIWTGVGALGSIGKASSAAKPGQVNMSLSTTDLGIVSDATRDDAIGRAVKVYLACLDEHRRIVAAELTIYRFINDVNTETGPINDIVITADTARARFRNSTNYIRYSPAAWRQKYPDDSYCDDIEALAASGLPNESGSNKVGTGGSIPKGGGPRYKSA